MKKLLFLLTVLFSVVLLFGHVEAVTLSLNPSNQSIIPGGMAIVDLEIAGLTAGGPDSLGAFELEVLYDPDILSFTSVNFGLFLGNPDLFEADIYFDNSSPGVVYLDETSWLEADSSTCIFCAEPYLDDLQGESFILAQFSFLGVQVGSSDLVIQNEVLSDAFGSAISNLVIENASVSVVPEPATILLLVSGMAGMGVFGRKKFRKK